MAFQPIDQRGRRKFWVILAISGLLLGGLAGCDDELKASMAEGLQGLTSAMVASSIETSASFMNTMMEALGGMAVVAIDALFTQAIPDASATAAGGNPITIGVPTI